MIIDGEQFNYEGNPRSHNPKMHYLTEEKSGIRVSLCKPTLVIGVLFEFGNVRRRLALAVVALDARRTTLLNVQWRKDVMEAICTYKLIPPTMRHSDGQWG